MGLMMWDVSSILIEAGAHRNIKTRSWVLHYAEPNSVPQRVLSLIVNASSVSSAGRYVDDWKSLRFTENKPSACSWEKCSDITELLICGGVWHYLKSKLFL